MLMNLLRVSRHAARVNRHVTNTSKYTDGAAVGGSKYTAAASKVAGAPLGSCRFVRERNSGEHTVDARRRAVWGLRINLLILGFLALPEFNGSSKVDKSP